MDRIGPGRRRVGAGVRQFEEEAFEAGVLGWGEPAQCDAVGHRRARDDLGLGLDQPPVAVGRVGRQAGAVKRGIEAGEFKRDLDVPAVADLVCQLQADYSARAYRRDPDYPDSPALIDAATRFIRDAVRA